MKNRLYILAFLLFVSIQAFPQDLNSSHPFIEKGKSWHMRMYNPQSLALHSWGMKPDVEYDLCFSENCDTIIDGMKYMRLSYQNTIAGEGFEIYK